MKLCTKQNNRGVDSKLCFLWKGSGRLRRRTSPFLARPLHTCRYPCTHTRTRPTHAQNLLEVGSLFESVVVVMEMPVTIGFAATMGADLSVRDCGRAQDMAFFLPCLRVGMLRGARLIARFAQNSTENSEARTREGRSEMDGKFTIVRRDSFFREQKPKRFLHVQET